MKIEWEVDDGYVGGSRPQETKIDIDELIEYDTEEEKKQFIYDEVQQDFEQKINFYVKNMDEILKVTEEVK